MKKSSLKKYLVVFILFGAISSFSFIKWKQSQKYPDKLIVEANYLFYACGDCTLDMKIKSVNNKNFEFVIGKEIYPKSEFKSNTELCDYIYSNFDMSETDTNSRPSSFFLEGYLHKNPRNYPWKGSCLSNPYFTIERIKYGQTGKWLDFK